MKGEESQNRKKSSETQKCEQNKGTGWLKRWKRHDGVISHVDSRRHQHSHVQKFGER